MLTVDCGWKIASEDTNKHAKNTFISHCVKQSDIYVLPALVVIHGEYSNSRYRGGL